ncbi:MAG: Protein DedA [Fimbriimonadaceae bacterium]|nr:Protein DedA [Fimbriimonadaceae bacterium]
MEWLGNVVDFFVHLDRHLDELIRNYGTGTYAILFTIIFLETGLVIMPFLPGDSLLFAAGMLANRPNATLDPNLLFLILSLAAICGDNVNYAIGKYLGPRLFRNADSRFFKREHLDKTHAFFERYGGKTIIVARFVPIVRTLAPFVAGLGTMTYGRFIGYSIFAAFFWVGVCMYAGFFFGAIPWVRDNFAAAIMIIVAASVIPAVIKILHSRRAKSVVSARRDAEIAESAHLEAASTNPQSQTPE